MVVSKAETPRSYNVMTRSGAEYRRNRRHLRKSKEDQALFTPDSSVGLDGQSDEVLPRERTSPNNHSTDEVVNQDQNSARGDAGMSGDIPQDTFEGQNVEHEGEALKRTRSGVSSENYGAPKWTIILLAKYNTLFTNIILIANI